MTDNKKWLSEKQKTNKTENKPKKANTKSYSKAKPDDPVTGIAPMSLKRNKYQDDIITAGAKKMNVSKQQFIRISFLEYAAQMGIY